METDEILKRRAKVGDPDAAFRFGYRIAFGRGRERDWPAVVRLWKSAAVAGHTRAKFYLGTCYDPAVRAIERNIGLAMRWYAEAAKSGYPEAQYNLALGYRNGDGVPQNRGKYLFWLRKADEAGDCEAALNLGYCYHEGYGVKKDFKRAVIFYRKAAIKGEAKAQWNLALCYQEGEGVCRNKALAVKWLKRAAALKHPGAIKKLARIRRRGLGQGSRANTRKKSIRQSAIIRI